VARIADQDPAFLEFAASHGLIPGTRISVLEVIPEAESLSVKASRKQPVSLSFSAAKKVHIERDGG
jgi:Fe2+ transport system protein FeoA